MDKKERIEILTKQVTLSNCYKSGVSEQELVLIKSFLILLRKERLLKGALSNLDAKDLRKALFQMVESSDNEIIIDLYKDYLKTICDKTRKLYFNNLFNIYLKISDYFIESNSKEFFDSELDSYFQTTGKHGSEAMQPPELTTILNYFKPSGKGLDYYNPFGGLASLSLGINKSNNYYGEELNEKHWLLARIRMLIYDKPKNFIYERSDSIRSLNSNENYDFICFNPPFNLRLKANEYDSIFSSDESYSTGRANSLIYSKIFNKLRKNGRMVFITPNNFLFSSSQKDRLFRESLIDNNHIELIISLPERSLSFSSIPINVVVLSKEADKEKSVKFIDAGTYITSTEKGINKIDYIKLLDQIHSNISNDHFREIPITEIKNNNYNLSVRRYLLEEKEGVELSNFVKIINFRTSSLSGKITKGAITTGAVLGLLFGPIGAAAGAGVGLINQLNKWLSKDIESKGKYVNIGGLKNDVFNNELDLLLVENKPIPKNSNFILRSALLVALKGNNLKPTYFKQEINDYQIDISKKVCFLSNDILALHVDESIIDINYLINELHSDHVIEQLNAYRSGTTIPTIKKEDILKIKIDIPDYYYQNKHIDSLKEQRAKVQGAKITYAQSIAREIRLENKILGLKEESSREIKSVRHTLRQYLNALKSNIGGTRSFIEKNEGKNIDLNTIYSHNLNRTFGEHLNSMEDTIESMSKQLESFDDSITSDKKEILHLESLIKEAQNRFKNLKRFSFDKLYVDIDSLVSEHGALTPYIEFNKEDFFKVFSNIVTNAQDHGFVDKSKKYIIQTSISLEPKERLFRLEISNNGEPMDENITFKDLITKGEKSVDSKGSGIGGSDIKNILSHHDAHFELEKYKNSEFSVKYILYFPVRTLIDALYENIT